jgi:hypothetical protein
MIKITTRGTRRTSRYLRNLPKNITNAIDEHNMEFSKAVQKSAKLRAPRDTGDLAKSITMKSGSKKGEYHINVDSPYGRYQEFGFKPHFIGYGKPTKNSAGTIQPKGNAKGPGIWVSKYTPFITPALEHQLARIQTTLTNAINKGMK